MDSTLAKEIRTESQLYVGNPFLIEDILKTYLAYTVQGTLIKSPLIRRLSDFITLRNKLKENWPGIYIPGLPFRSEEDKDKSNVINTFCSKITTIPYLFETKEFKIFISNTPDLTASLNSIPIESFEEIADKYARLFSSLQTEEFNLAKYKERTNKFKIQIVKAYQGITLFNEILIGALTNHEKEKNDTYSFLKGLTHYENSTLLNLARNKNEFMIMNNLTEELKMIEKNDINPYISIYISSENEQIETGALVEALHSLEYIYDNYESTFQNLLVIEERMKEMTQSKTNWMSYLVLKSPDEEFNELQRDKVLIEIEHNSIKNITKYALINIQSVLSTVKQKKLDKYYEELQMISDKTIANIQIYDEFWKKLNEMKYIAQTD